MFLLNDSRRQCGFSVFGFTIQNVPIKSAIAINNALRRHKFTIQNVPIKFKAGFIFQDIVVFIYNTKCSY